MVFFSLPVKSEKEKVQGFARYAIRIYPPQGRKKQTETSLFAGKYQSFVQRNMSRIWPCENKYEYISFVTKGIQKTFFLNSVRGLGLAKYKICLSDKKLRKISKMGRGGGFWANQIRNSFSKNLKFPKLFIVNKSSPIHVHNKKSCLLFGIKRRKQITSCLSADTMSAFEVFF